MKPANSLHQSELKWDMCERCDAWRETIDTWFGDALLAKLETFVEEDVAKKQLLAKLGLNEADLTQQLEKTSSNSDPRFH